MDKNITITFSLDKTRLLQWGKTLLPFLLIGAVLFVLNWGLRTRLAPEEPFDAFEYPYEESFESVAVHRWFKPEATGKWALANGTLTQSDPDVEIAPIFISHWLVEDQPYRMSAMIDISSAGSSGGINFNAQYPEVYAQHQRVVVRQEQGEYTLVTGVVTPEEGFKEQFTVPLGVLEQPFRLDVLVSEGVYAIQINGKLYIENRPLVYKNGLVGFVADGIVSIDDLSLTAVDEEAFLVDLAEHETLPAQVSEPVVGDMVYTSDFAGGTTDNGWVAFSGDWQLVDGYLMQRDPTGFDHGIAYQPSTFQSYILKVSLDHKDGIGAGVLFNMPTPSQTNGAHMVRFAETGNGVFWGYYDNAGDFVGQGYAIMPTVENSSQTIKVISRENSYDLFVNNQQVAAAVPLIRNNGHIGLITSQSAAAYALVDVSGFNGDLLDADGNGTSSSTGTVTESGTTPNPALATPTPATGTEDWTAPLKANPELYASGFAPDAASRLWQPINGHWRVKDDLLVQTDQGGYDFGILYTGAVFENFRYDVPLTHTGGQGGGLLFNAPELDSLAWASIVRYSDTTNKLMWGYYDADGTFKGQGSVDVPSPEQEAHTLSVQTSENTYAVLLDGESVVEGVPLARKRGYIGLVTARSAVRFGPLSISTDKTPTVSPTSSSVDMLGNMRIINGSWEQADGVITQTKIEPGDYFLTTDVSAGVYTLQTTITLPDNPELGDAGGGVIFHMPEQDKRANAHLVRLSGGGRGVFWGYFDEDNAFVGQGSASFTDNETLQSDNSNYDLKIVVERDHYALYINDVQIAKNVTLINTQGYIGLLSYRGPVSFGQIDLTVGSTE